MFVHMNVCMYECMYLCMYVCMYVYVYVYVRIYVCIAYVCVLFHDLHLRQRERAKSQQCVRVNSEE